MMMARSAQSSPRRKNLLTAAALLSFFALAFGSVIYYYVTR